MKFKANDLWAVAGVLLMAAIACNTLFQYGRTWTPGSYGLPVSILSADGTTYADGTPIPAINRRLIDSGMEAVVAFCILALISFVICDLIRISQQNQKATRELAEGYQEFLRTKQEYDRIFGPGSVDRLEQDLLEQGVLEPLPPQTSSPF